MSISYEIKGTVAKILATNQISDKFRKRGLVVGNGQRQPAREGLRNIADNGIDAELRELEADLDERGMGVFDKGEIERLIGSKARS